MKLIIFFVGCLISTTFAQTNVTTHRVPTFEDLESIGNSATSPDDFLKKLKDSRFILPYRIEIIESGSKQEASWESPREARFIPIGKKDPNDEALIITYNNDPKQRGYSAIEIMKTGENFKLKEFNYVNGKLHTDSKSCVACHGVDPTGRWRAWANWSTVLCGGSKQEITTKGSKENSCENQYWRIRKQGRYSILPDATDLKKESPENKDYADVTPGSQLVLFDEIMNRSSAQRIARKIHEAMSEHPSLEHFKYALIGISLCSTSTISNIFEIQNPDLSEKISKWIPKTALSLFAKRGFQSYQQMLGETKALHSQNEKDKKQFSHKEVLLDTNRVAALRYIFNLQKIDIQNWNMEGLQYAHSDFRGDLSLYWKSLYPKVLTTNKADKELADELHKLSQENKQKICDRLSKLSLTSLDSYVKKHDTEAGVCITCNK